MTMIYETEDYEVNYRGNRVGAFVRNVGAKIKTTHALVVTGFENDEAIDTELRYAKLAQAYETWLKETYPERLRREKARIRKTRKGILEGTCDRSGKPFPYLYDASDKLTVEAHAAVVRESGRTCEIVEVERV
jgi:hypothetical protein